MKITVRNCHLQAGEKDLTPNICTKLTCSGQNRLCVSRSSTLDLYQKTWSVQAQLVVEETPVTWVQSLSLSLSLEDTYFQKNSIIVCLWKSLCHRVIPEVPLHVKFLAKRTGNYSASPPGVKCAARGRNLEHSPESSDTCPGFKTFWTRIKNNLKNTHLQKAKKTIVNNRIFIYGSCWYSLYENYILFGKPKMRLRDISSLPLLEHSFWLRKLRSI